MQRSARLWSSEAWRGVVPVGAVGQPVSSRPPGLDGFPRFVAHSAPAAAELCRRVHKWAA